MKKLVAIVCLVMLWSAAVSIAAETFIPRGAVWKYLDNGSDQGTAWRELVFDDSSWASGPAQLGYGDGDEATVVNSGPGGARFITTYFRRSFNVVNASSFIVVRLQVQRDDGVVVYLNGTEIYRDNMPGGPVLFDTFAFNAADDGRDFLPSVTIDPALLRDGANVIAAEIHQSDRTSSDISFDLEFTGSSENNPPQVTLTNPLNGSVLTAPANVEIRATATDPEGNLAGVEFYVGTSLLGTDTTSPYTAQWSNVPVGTYSVFAVAYDVLGLRATSTVASVTVELSSPPVVSARTPAPGGVNSLTEILVTFSEPVSGVRAADFLVNGIPSTSVSGTGAAYTFRFAQPQDGPVFIAWNGQTGIQDFENPPRAFDPQGTGARWQYTLTDTVAPAVALTLPGPGATVRSLTQLEITFSEPVTGVDAADLLMNSVAATALTGSGAGPYLFQFRQPVNGPVTVAWAGGHGIRDLASTPNAFGGGSWSYTLNSAAVFEGAVVINEIMYHPGSAQPADEWIELYNRGGSAVNLAGWALTRGADFAFPNISLPAGGYLVVAANVAAFQARYPGVNNVVGGWSGQLNNTDEDIELEDANGDRVDILHYFDEGDFAFRRRSPILANGWDWFAEHDGLGRSLELRNPVLSNNSGQNWNSSTGIDGTPGSANSIATNNIPPMILDVAHTPAVPKSTDPITIKARIVDEATTGLQVRLWWRNASSANPPAFASVTMFDDGAHGDGGLGDGVFGGTLAPQADKTVVEFYVEAIDSGGRVRTWPAPAQESGGAFTQTANALLQVDNATYAGNQPVYQIIMTESDRAAFASQNRNLEALVNCSLVAIENGAAEIRYSTGMRYRGAGSRGRNPPTYRLNIPSDRRWSGRTALNLNSQYVHSQVIGSQVAIKSGLPTEYARAVQLRINSVNPANAGSPQFGSYAAVEPTNGELIDNHLPDDSGGNVYRASTGAHSATLNYLGTNPNAYISAGYLKNSNGSENDWTDLMNLTFALDPATTPDSEYVAAVRRNANVELWLRYFAVLSIMEYTETALASGRGDDYGLYRGIKDPRFIILAHDFDTVFGQGDSAGNVNEDIYVATAVATMNRFLRHPEFEPLFHAEFRRQIATTFSTNSLFPMIDLYLGDWVPAQTIQAMKSFIVARNAAVLGQLPPAPVPVVATVSGEPATPTYLNTASLTVGGQGITHYRYRLNGGAFGAETPVSTPIDLSGLADGTYTVYVIGRDAASNWQAESAATVSATWTVLSGLRGVIINEALARNVSAVNHSGTFPDLIELHNPRGTTADISGWRMTDDLDRPNRFVFPPGTIIGPGGYLVLYANNPDGTPGLHLGFALGQDGETIHLLDAAANGDRVIDSLQFGFQLPDRSVGRINGGHWALCTPTFGSANVAAATGSQSALRINEWLANGVSPFFDDFIELYNPETLPVAIGGLYLTDRIVGLPLQHRITPLSFLAGGGYRAFIADGNASAGTDHVNFKLGSEQGEIGLLGPGARVIDCIIYGPQLPGISQGRAPNGGDRIVSLSPPTPGAPNPVPVTPIPPQLISLLPINDTFLWRYNGTGADLGTTWKDVAYPDAGWSEGPAILGFENAVLPEPLRTVIPLASGRITYYFRTRFNVPSGLNLSGLELNHVIDDGAIFYLNGVEILRYNMPSGPVTFTTQASTSVGDAGYVGPISIPLDRIITGENVMAVEVHQNGNNSSDVVMGVRLDGIVLTNAPSAAGVLINEVLANNQSFTNSDGTITDWVELYNPSNASVDLAGMSLSDEITDSRRWVFPAGSVIPASGYLVVRFDPDAVASVTPKGQLNTGFGLKASGDEVYLFNRPVDGGALMDSVTFGLQALDLSIARVPNAGSNWVLSLPTPGGVNIASSLGNSSVLSINEWMADPRSGEDWFELYNPSAQPIAIGGMYLTDDLNAPTKSRLPALSFIGTGLQGFQRFEADNNPAGGGDHVAFRLAAGGEAIALVSTNGAVITSLTFGAQAKGVSEGRLPDGSATIVRFPTTATPGAANYLLIPNVVINEALSHTDAPLEDAIEFYNPTAQGVDISGWYFSDRRSDLRLFRIPQGTVVGAGGYVVLYEYQFNPDFTGQVPNFALDSARGEEVYLSQTDAQGNLTGYRATARFGAGQNGVSFGRHVTSTGADFTAMSRRSFGADSPVDLNDFRSGRGAPNPAPYVGPVVINEVMYHPPDVGGLDNEIDEFIELRSVTNVTVSLFDPAFPANTWRLRDAVDFDFPTGVTLPAGGYLVVVSFDPVANPSALAAFRQKYGVDSQVPVHGPWRGRLANDSENVELYKPDAPQAVGTPNAGFVPYIQVDKVKYSDSPPWAALADGVATGVGYSLSKRVSAAYGNEATNWVAAVPSPGAGNGAGAMTPPLIQSLTPSQTVAAGGTASLVVSAFGSSPLTFQWQLDGVAIVDETNAVLSVPNFQAANAGVYGVVVVNGAGSAFATSRVDVRSAPVIVRQPLDVGAGIGTSAQLSVVAGGSLPLSYQWQRNGVDVTGANAALFIIPNAQPANEGSYRVIISNAFGAVTSTVATLIVQTPPSIVQQPQGGEVIVGSPASLAVQATGTAPLRYQWQKDGVNVPNATNATLTFTSARLIDSGIYRVLISNSVGSLLSGPAELVVTPPPTISVVATDPSANEAGGNDGQFTVFRSGSLASAVAVNFAITGNAIPGSDYVALTSPITIPAGSNAVVITVTPLNDSLPEGTESVVLTVLSGAGYVVGSPVSATVFITDDDNLPPSVAVTSPTNGAIFNAPATVTITATATDPDGSVALVEFYLNGTNKVGQSTTAPYSVTLSGLPAGTYLATAVATDELGAFRASIPVQIIVNALPTVSITTPTAGALFSPPANINVVIAAADADGSIARVELFASGTLLATLTTAPYTYAWTGVPEGNYVLTARATDNRGATAVTANTAISVVVPTPTFADQFAARGLLTGYTNQVGGTNTTYTKEPGEPRHENRSGAKSAWISWTAPSSGPVSMNTFGSSFDTVLSVYTGSSVSNLVRVAGNDDANDLVVQSAVTFNAVGGTSYQIAVDGFSATAGGVIQFTIELANLRPVIVTGPQPVTVNQGSNAAFSVVATGPGTLSYRWQFNGVNINGATAANYTRNNAQPAHEGLYTVIVTNVYGAVTSAPAMLVVRAAPAITSQPATIGVIPGETATFSVTATGWAPLTYQWKLAGGDIPGATNATLTLTNVRAVDEGSYTVVIANSVGAVTSAAASLIVLDGLVMTEVVELIPMISDWKYDQSGTDRGTAWRAPGFDDSGWPSGTALLGFEDSFPYPYAYPVATPLLSPQAGGPITVYFRSRFTFTNTVGTVTLFSENLVDDGAAYYLNGTEVGRLRLGSSATNFNSLASTVNPEGQSAFLVFSSAPLVTGDNVMAVEVHQSSSTSSDVIFGMALTAVVTVTNQPVIVNAQRLGNGSFEVTLEGISGRTYAIEAASGFGATWSTLVTFSNFTGQATYVDTSAPTATRFYRGRLVK